MTELPEENELVIAKVKKILDYGAFCELTEYNVDGFLHLSEVAPRWIKNIYEFISEGQRLVLKVIRVDKAKGQVDVSLKRVSEEEKRKKIEAYNKENRAKKIIQVALDQAKVKSDAQKIFKEAETKYGSLDNFLVAILDEEKKAFEGIEFPEKAQGIIIDIVKKSVKKPVARVKAMFNLKVYESNGIELIKKVLADAEKFGEIKYLGAPRYSITVVDEDFKKANRKIQEAMETIEKGVKGRDAEFTWEKVKK
ncbi:MAG: S1 RNA-binding domain-containing protein [Candidatus Anstonellales archaeon]